MVPGSVEERLAVLEERTTPVPKSALQRVKEWGGVATLVVALAYSFPLGIWDRWITSRETRRAAELVELRGALEQSSIMLAESARTLAMISDPALHDTIARAFNTRLYIIMEKNKELFAKRKDDMTSTELLLLGYLFTVLSRYEAALEFYGYAREKSSQDPLLLAEIMRGEANALLAPSRVRNIDEASRKFQRALAALEHGQTTQEVVAYATLSAEWGLLEMTAGDWLCGRTLTEAALQRLSAVSPWLGDQDKLSQVIIMKTKALRPKLGQPEQGCFSTSGEEASSR